MNLPYEREEKKLSSEELLATGRDIMLKEAEALKSATERMGAEMASAAHLVSRCRGRIVVSGLGKSGHVGRKTAATFASLGVPAFFLHATEGAHGDLGMVCREDVGYFLSNSGETQELIALIPYFKRLGAPIIAVTGNPESTLAREADIVLNCHVESEADPLKLAPTSSTTLQMALGDAVAGMSTLLLGLQKEDFALFHPGGSLGKRLLLRVSDLMGSGDRMPITKQDARVRDALFDITSKGYGATAIVDDEGKLTGVFTDGDLRRFIEKEGLEGLELPVFRAMTKNPRVIGPERLAVEAVRIVEQWEVSALIVVQDGKPIGMVHIHEILKAGVA
ncbi:KpsF/GutQ family sugar-phosphate isomerase [Cloacibacillus porcorum]|uniref:KpsF/GutQ family sugar-phosphate isomerase n=1 Tax=Cloacibacillus porcorum TaxID=1197717 RepID=UPI002357DC68|nr:KpsF/GutQ family sugar-phosphate isomerase [Cloacibacillus porcorum]MCI5865025.1 KpsF/GutQ family sugar-phosphate isomerase [Cloacibacillus porcorum]